MVPQQLVYIYTQKHMLQRFLAQDDERTLNTKPRKASNDAEDGLVSIMAGCCQAGLKTSTLALLSEKKLKLYCSVLFRGRCIREI